MQFSLAFWYKLLSLRTKYSQHTVHKDLQSMFLLSNERLGKVGLIIDQYDWKLELQDIFFKLKSAPGAADVGFKVTYTRR